MESTRSWPKSANQVLFPHQPNGAPGFVQRFYRARAAFLAHRVGRHPLDTHDTRPPPLVRSHACVLQVYTPVWDEELPIADKRDKMMNGKYRGVKIVPLLVAADSLEAVYSKDIFDSTLTEQEHLQRAQLVLCPRTGDPCKVIPAPTVDGTKYPYGSILDTDACPLWTINPLCLRQYLQVNRSYMPTCVCDSHTTHAQNCSRVGARTASAAEGE